MASFSLASLECPWHAAAIVMLGGPDAGTNSGFWFRFVMREAVGNWLWN